MDIVFYFLLLLLILLGIFGTRWYVTRRIEGHGYEEDPDWVKEVFEVVSKDPPETLMDRALDDEGGMGRLSGIKP